MNAITPENEIPPAQSTAASGTFPTEQTKERTATSGPTITFSSSWSAPALSVRKRSLKNVHRQQRDEPGDQEAGA